MNLYLVTIKKNVFQYTPREELNKVYNNLQVKTPKVKYLDHKFELDSHRRWHLHSLATSHKAIYYKPLQTQYFTTHFKKIPKEDYDNVIAYLYKDWHLDPSQMDIESYANFHYMFREN